MKSYKIKLYTYIVYTYYLSVLKQPCNKLYLFIARIGLIFII